MITTKKQKNIFPTDKGEKIYPFLLREREYSNRIALSGFSQEETDIIYNLLQRIRKSIEVDWELVKKGNKREY